MTPGRAAIPAASSTSHLKDADRVAALLALADAAQILRDQLLTGESPDSARARALLAERAVPRAAAVAHQLGYAPPGWTCLTRQLRAAGHSEQTLLDAGLSLRTRRGTVVDRFRDRLMFPLHNIDGQSDGAVIGFLGRTVPAPSSAARSVRGPLTAPAKYLNSPDSSLCHKSEVLYGLGAPPVRTALADGARPVLVEGPLDALAVTWASHTATTGSGLEHGAGAGHGGAVRGETFVGVAGCGTALRPAQAALLAEHSGPARDRLVVAYDSDPAGQAGAASALGVLLEAGVWPHAVRLPDGLDPAALMQARGPAALLAALQHAVPLADLAVDARLARWDTRWAESTVGAARDAAALIASLPAQHIARQVQRIAQRLHLPPDQVTDLVATAVSRPPSRPRTPRRASASSAAGSASSTSSAPASARTPTPTPTPTPAPVSGTARRRNVATAGPTVITQPAPVRRR